MKTHPSSNQLLQQNYAHGLLLRKSTRSALPCAFAASELLIASAQCSIEDREWSWPGRFLSWYVQSKKMIRKILSIYEVHMYIYIYSHTIWDRKLSIRHPSITDFHVLAFSCLHLSIHPSTYLYLTVTLNDIHIIRILLVPLARLRMQQMCASKGQLYIIWTRPSERMLRQAFTRLFTHWDKEMCVSNKPSYLCQSNHGTIMALSIKISDLSNFSGNQTSRTLPNLNIFFPSWRDPMLRSFALKAISHKTLQSLELVRFPTQKKHSSYRSLWLRKNPDLQPWRSS